MQSLFLGLCLTDFGEIWEKDEKIKKEVPKYNKVNMDNSQSPLAYLQERLNTLSEEYMASKEAITDSTPDSYDKKSVLKEKYESLIKRTISQFRLPREEPELTEILQYMTENADEYAYGPETDKWIAETLFERLEFLKDTYSEHPVIKRYVAKLEKEEEEERIEEEQDSRKRNKRRAGCTLVIFFILLLIIFLVVRCS